MHAISTIRTADVIRARIDWEKENAIDVLGFAAKLPALPESFLTYQNRILTEVKNLIEEKLGSSVEKQTQQKLKRIESRDSLVKELEDLRDSLHKSGRADLEKMCVEALARIDDEYRALKAE